MFIAAAGQSLPSSCDGPWVLPCSWIRLEQSYIRSQHAPVLQHESKGMAAGGASGWAQGPGAQGTQLEPRAMGHPASCRASPSPTVAGLSLAVTHLGPRPGRAPAQ